jgi:hypothetical protein
MWKIVHFNKTFVGIRFFEPSNWKMIFFSLAVILVWNWCWHLVKLFTRRYKAWTFAASSYVHTHTHTHTHTDTHTHTHRNTHKHTHALCQFRLHRGLLHLHTDVCFQIQCCISSFLFSLWSVLNVPGPSASHMLVNSLSIVYPS